MTAYVGVGGAWKEVEQPAVGVSGAFNDNVDGWVGVGGAWKQFHTSGSRHTLTRGFTGSDEKGFRESTYGSLSPNTLAPGAFPSEYTVTVIATHDSLNRLWIEFGGIGIPQTAWTSFECSLGTFLAASATTYYSEHPSTHNTRWEFAIGVSVQFPNSGTEEVLFLP